MCVNIRIIVVSAVDGDSQFVGREGLCSRIVVERRVLNLVESVLLAFSIYELAPTERIEIHVTGAVCSVVAVDAHILPLCELQFVAVEYETLYFTALLALAGTGAASFTLLYIDTVSP